ncbi:ABC transporter substrate binding protein [Oxalobacteraceae bacterium R-40]|uniref:ABC transporter substrate binding protein n=1 Tax=Keguizhuia sedimenti TaxID=3064264 RepID=A0ABU1BR04_9BURK|nr:ABC transporter substrate binding protein [Oxalobacteraceae bacterium R-40]
MLLRLLLAFVMMTAGTAHADIILLLSDEKPSITGVGEAIHASYSKKVEVFNLKGNRNRDNQVARAVLDSDIQHVIAVGLQAAQLARNKLSSKQVVFCQVLNFEEFDLVTPWMKGISALPSLTKQFAAWKQLDPSLRRIGVITGRNNKYLTSEAEAAAKKNGLELVHVEAASERAVMFAAQELYDKKIQGIWLAPDSSILSQRSVMDLMSFSAKHSLQVLSFSSALLSEGALISTAPDFGEIARLAIERVKKTQDAPSIPGDGIHPLTGAKVIISSTAASRFGLGIPTKLRGQADVQ